VSALRSAPTVMHSRASVSSLTRWGMCDAADHLKLHFPLCFAASNLAWGFVEFQDVRARPAQHRHDAQCTAHVPVP